MCRGFGLLLPAAAVIIAAATAPARAQDYPTRPVEVIVPFAAGGGSELLARLISDGLSKRLGQPFVVLNRPGANTNLGTLAAVRSKPDGYTLLIASIGLAANPSLYKKLAFEPQAALEPITLIANSPTVLAVPPTLPEPPDLSVQVNAGRSWADAWATPVMATAPVARVRAASRNPRRWNANITFLL